MSHVPLSEAPVLPSVRKSPPSAQGSSSAASEPRRGTDTFWAEAVPLTTPPPPTLAQSGSDESRRGVTSFWVDEEEPELPRTSPSRDGRRRRGEAGVGGRGPRGQDGRDADEGSRGSRCARAGAASPAAGREGDRAPSGRHEHLQTRLRAPRGLDGHVRGQRIEKRVSSSGVAQREPTDTRLKGVLEQAKGPAIRQRSVGVSPGQFPRSLGEIGVSSTPSSRKWERKLCPALVPCYLCISCVCHCLSCCLFP